MEEVMDVELGVASRKQRTGKESGASVLTRAMELDLVTGQNELRS